jgi:hypothetical protein
MSGRNARKGTGNARVLLVAWGTPFCPPGWETVQGPLAQMTKFAMTTPHVPPHDTTHDTSHVGAVLEAGK